jgi:glycosyltransferase involved in cell wall biosynthesis
VAAPVPFRLNRIFSLHSLVEVPVARHAAWIARSVQLAAARESAGAAGSDLDRAGTSSMNPAARGRSFDISVVVPFRNAAQTLGHQLEALASQDFAGSWEVVAVDNRSEDESRQIAESFSGRLELLVVDALERLGAGYARNVGAGHASARKLLFVDADDEVAPGYISTMAAALDRHDFVTSAFDQETLNPEWVRAAHGPAWRNLDEPLPDQFGILPNAGASIGISRAAFDAVGGFPEDLARMQDIALSWEVQRAGVELHYVPEALYRVRYRDRLPDLFRQGLAGSSCAPLLYKRYRSAGMQRRTVNQMLRSWARLVVDLSKARTRAQLAPLMVRLGREIGRVIGSIRHRVFFP